MFFSYFFIKNINKFIYKKNSLQIPYLTSIYKESLKKT